MSAGQKRRADEQLTADHFRGGSDDELDSRDDRPVEHFATTPQIADKEELARRRMVKVRRPATTATASTGGIFKNLATQAPGTSTTKTFGFGPPKQPCASNEPVMGFGFPRKSTSMNLDTTTTNSTNNTTTSSSSSSAPKLSFGFGSAAGTTLKSAFGSAPTPTCSTTAAPAAPAAPPAVPTPSSSSSAPTTSATTTSSKPLFGGGEFSFRSAVSTFVEAQKKMDEARASSAHDANDGEDDEPSPAETAVFESVVVASGEVLASAPVKLFRFNKADGQWAECGTGDAKLKRQEVEEAMAYRLMVRDGYSLNAVLGHQRLVVGKVEARHCIFTVGAASGPQTYLMRFTGTHGEANTKTFVAELNTAVEAADKVPAKKH